MIYWYFILFLCWNILSSCSFFTSSVASVRYGKGCQKFSVGAGPEDFAYDQTASRLLVSSLNRREWSKTGDIYSFDLKTHQTTSLERVNEPSDLQLRPHGVSLTKDEKQNRRLLYVISHDQKNEEVDRKHSVVIYQVFSNKLKFVKRYRDPLLYSPNDLFATPSGEIYLTNDMDDHKSFLEVLFQLRKGSVVYYNGHHWRQIITKIGFANGIHKMNDKLFVTSSFEDVLYEYKLQKKGKPTLVHQYSISSPDNIHGSTSGKLFIASHLNSFSFLRHAGDPEYHSPSAIYSLDTIHKKTRIVYANSGKEISAASSGEEIHHKLYMTQVFENFLLVCQ